MPEIIARIRQELIKGFAPERLEIIDQSEHHAGHSGYREGTSTHLRILIVSRSFCGLSKLERHRRVYQQIQPLLGEIHALSLDLKEPE